MIKFNDEKYKVLDHDNYPGLTVGSYLQKPGTIFSKSQWKFGDEALRNAVASNRCVLLKSSKKKEKVKNNDSK